MIFLCIQPHGLFHEGRSVNSHVLVLIRENIKAFEDANGTIEGDIQPDVNVKPTRKQ